MTDSHPTPKPPAQKNNTNRNCLGCLGGCVLIVLLLVIGTSVFIWYTIRSTQQVPEFYARALESTPESSKAQGDSFERNVAQIQRAATGERPWKVELTDEQFNGWLASDLPEKFPDALPSSISDPRISFSENEIRIAFRFETNGVKTVVVAKGDLFCTETPNEVAIKIASVQSGIITIPIDRWLERSSNVLDKNGYSIFWTVKDGCSLGLFPIPEHVASVDDRFLILESIELAEGTLTLAGVSIERDQLPSSDSGPNDSSSK